MATFVNTWCCVGRLDPLDVRREKSSQLSDYRLSDYFLAGCSKNENPERLSSLKKKGKRSRIRKSSIFFSGKEIILDKKKMKKKSKK